MIRTQALYPTETDLRARARADLRIGLPVALVDETGPLLAIAAEVVTAERLAALTGDPGAELVLTRWRADTLKIRAYDGDLARLPVAPDTPLAQIRAVIDPAGDLASPMKGPFSALRGGDVGLHRAALALAKSARILPAVVVRRVDTVPEGITTLDGPQAISVAARVDHVIAARLPITASLNTRLHIFRPHDGAEEHYAVEIGTPDRTHPVLARLHSACFTGDVLGSLKCDCGPQLNGALEQMATAGGGVLCYLNQEGRGIGLANKMRAYALQDQGFDTVEANHRLGFEDDERDFGIGAEILKGLGVSQVRLMTNNPRKVEMLRASGVAVAERVPLWVGRNALNDRYLDVKAEKSGHMR